MKNFDKNNDQKIDFEEFIDLMTANISDLMTASTDKREELLKVFNLFLEEDKGYSNDRIKISHLPKIAKEL